MIIGISGKIGSGKDSIGKIIRALVDKDLTEREVIEVCTGKLDIVEENSDWKIKKFADKLKDTVCLWTGCTREQLEDADFKNKEIGEEWNKWFINYSDRYSSINNYFYNQEDFNKEIERLQNDMEYIIHSKGFVKLTYRMLLQIVGTEVMRNTIHINGWVNNLFAEYVEKELTKKELILISEKYGNKVKNNDYSTITYQEIKSRIPNYLYKEKSNWIITDCRFPNELEAIKSRGGISIRVNRSKSECTCSVLTAENCIKQCDKSTRIEHISEKELDNSEFNYVITNDGTIEDLIEEVKNILIKEKLI